MFTQTPSWKRSQIDGLESFDHVKNQLGIDYELYERPRTDVGAEGWKDIVRTDNGRVVHSTRESYRLINVDDFGKFVEASLADEKAEWDSFYIAPDSRMMFSTVRLDEPVHIPGDKSALYPYVGFSNRVDGNGALNAFFAMVRATCANMLNGMLATAEQDDMIVRFKHTANFSAARAVEITKSMIQGERVIARDFQTEATRLNSKVVVVEDFLKKWLPHSEDETERVSDNIDAKRIRFFEALHSEYAPERQDTAWGLLQAATLMYQYEKEDRGLERAFAIMERNPLKSAYTILQGMAA